MADMAASVLARLKNKGNGTEQSTLPPIVLPGRISAAATAFQICGKSHS